MIGMHVNENFIFDLVMMMVHMDASLRGSVFAMPHADGHSDGNARICLLRNCVGGHSTRRLRITLGTTLSDAKDKRACQYQVTFH